MVRSGRGITQPALVITCIELGPTKRLLKRWRMHAPGISLENGTAEAVPIVGTWIGSGKPVFITCIRIGATKIATMLEVDQQSMWSWKSACWNPRAHSVIGTRIRPPVTDGRFTKEAKPVERAR